MLIKIIWDFRGDDGHQTAIHHAIHLKEFCENNKIEYQFVDAEILSDLHYITFIITQKENVIVIRDALKPHRAIIVE
jgi:DNA-binding MltR family transcriptional regulator